MLGPIINAGLIITLFSIAAPFIFVLLIIRMVIGGNRRQRKHRRREMNDEAESMEKMSRGMRELKKRIDNLETLKTRNKYRER